MFNTAVCLVVLLCSQVSFGSPSPDDSMGIAKRGIYGWIDPEYEYGGSMADSDWGWKKRSSGLSYSQPRKYSSSSHSYYSPPLSLPSRRHSSSSYYGPRSSITAPKQYAYHSMADADWGWKKRKRSEVNRAIKGEEAIRKSEPSLRNMQEDPGLLLSLLSSKKLNPDYMDNRLY